MYESTITKGYPCVTFRQFEVPSGRLGRRSAQRRTQQARQPSQPTRQPGATDWTHTGGLGLRFRLAGQQLGMHALVGKVLGMALLEQPPSSSNSPKIIP
jgi:hypothetical protein